MKIRLKKKKIFDPSPSKTELSLTDRKRIFEPTKNDLQNI